MYRDAASPMIDVALRMIELSQELIGLADAFKKSGALNERAS
jgi:hypothetical protein